MIKSLSTILSLTLLFCTFSSCNSSNKQDSKVIKVGIVSGPEKEIAEEAAKIAKEQYDVDVELITFNDYVVPNEALNQGDIDANAFQHQPYLDEQSKQRGYTLTPMGKTFVYPIVAYSKKIKHIDELKAGQTIVIPNDPTNGGRALLLLQKQGLITLKENAGGLPRVTDITSNPKQVKFLELEAPQLPRVLDDKEVYVAVINNTFAAQAGLDPEVDGLFSEDKDSPYVNLIVTREDNKDDERIKKFVEAYHSPEVEAVAKKVFKGHAIKGW